MEDESNYYIERRDNSIGWKIMSNDSNFDLEEIIGLMEEATLSITHEPTKICFHYLYYKNQQGQVYRDKSGRFVIVLKTDIDLQDLYSTWLHEMCHIYLKHCVDFLPSDYYIPAELEDTHSRYGYLLEMTEMEERKYQETPKEMETESTADSLDHFLQQKALELYGNDEIITRLRVATNIILKR